MMPLLGHEVAEMRRAPRPPRLRRHGVLRAVVAALVVLAALASAQFLGARLYGVGS